MNSKKKIIDTLRSADKASVEKLMADEMKKNEIFAKAVERASGSADTDFGETVSGVEHYDRKISMTRIASIAAAAVLVTGGVLGGFKLMKNDRLSSNNHGSSELTTSATDEITTEVTTTEAVTTFEVTTGLSVLPVEVPVTTEPHDDVPEVLTGEWLRERCLNATHYYDKFSADIYYFHALYGQNISDWETNGTVKIDNTAMNAEMYEENSDAYKGTYDRSYSIFLNNIYVYINQNHNRAQNQHDEGKYCNIESVDTLYKWYKFKPDRPVLSGCLYYIVHNSSETYQLYDGSDVEYFRNETPWTVTGERTENGRRIASVSFSYEELREGKYEPRYITADIDAETGLWLAYELRTDDEYFGNGYLLVSFKATNYKFNDEAEAPMTADEVYKYLDENGYEITQSTSY